MRIFTLASLLLLTAFGCGHDGRTASAGPPLLVAAAANTRFAMEELTAAFTEAQDHAVELVVASSGQLTAQVRNGAPFDVFLSADMKYPLSLQEKGFTAGAPRPYAQGNLVLWTLQEVPLDSFGSLREPAFARIAVANPQNAPYGAAAVQALRRAGLYDTVRARLVYGESISQVNQFVTSRSVQAGFTAKSVVVTKMKGRGRYMEVPEALYTPIEQGMVVLKHGAEAHAAAAEAFVAFLGSDEAAEILRKHGYGVPGRAAGE